MGAGQDTRVPIGGTCREIISPLACPPILNTVRLLSFQTGHEPSLQIQLY